MENEMSEESSVEETPKMEMTQAELDALVKDRLTRERTIIHKEYGKKFEGVDVDEYRTMKAEQEEKQLESDRKSEEFDKAYQNLAEKKDAEINKYKGQLESAVIDGQLAGAIASAPLVQGSQPSVMSLLRGEVRLGEHGQAEVVDKEGTVRLNSDGTTMTITERMSEFLTEHQYFVQPTGSGTGTQSSAGNVGNIEKPKNVSQMSHAEYKEHRKSIGRG